MAARSSASIRPTFDASLLTLSGALLVAGLSLNLAAKVVHPAGSEDSHREIFAEYAASDAWVAIHIVQFLGGLAALAGLLVLCQAARARGRSSIVSGFAMGTSLTTAAVLALLQALDGVALKQAVDAWASAPPAEEPTRFAAAETIRWLEWGIQSYFRVLFGMSFALVGVVIAIHRVSAWLAWPSLAAGVVSVGSGIDVAYSGLESDFGAAADIAFGLLAAVLAVGTLIRGVRGLAGDGVALTTTEVTAGQAR